MTEGDRIWIREQATKIRAAHHVEPIRFVAPKAPFCEAAAEWDHHWHIDGTGVERCSECGVIPAGQEP